MESKTKACIISVGIGGWYAQGIKRLRESLIYHGFAHDVITWSDILPPFSEPHHENPYSFKIAAFAHAMQLGYTHIIWLDASFWAVRDPYAIFDIISEKGFYLWSSGVNCAQQCNDYCLAYFNVTRDTAEGMKGIASGIVGLNIENPTAKEFLDQWIKACSNGVFKGSRDHANQSQDPRFLFHRQDQSAASIIANKLNMNIDECNEHVMYYRPVMPESIIFTLRGL